MQIPRARGPISRYVIESLPDGSDHVPPHGLTVEPGRDGVLADEDVQLALWTIYELHYRGFDSVPADREWDLGLISLRLSIEQAFEAELRAGTEDRLADLRRTGDVGEQLLGLVAADDSPSPAAFLQRKASREQLVDYLRERSVQQLKESDPQSFVLPRLDGPAKAALAELQYDEYGGGRPERLHATMYADALEAVGLDRSYGAYIDDVSALSLACGNTMTLFGLNRRLRGAAMGHLAAFEASSSVPSRKIAAGLERVGFTDTVSAYFHEHVEADAVHEHIAATDICGALVAEDPSLRADILFGAASCLHLDALSGGELLDRWTAELEQAS
jgi:pyrroloquinoline quinone (PQQ) biosynthesis protein C